MNEQEKLDSQINIRENLRTDIYQFDPFVTLQVLKNEIKYLQTLHQPETQEGTGHFNTAIGVLRWRIQELERSVLVII
jgi:hypothetical protein